MTAPLCFIFLQGPHGPFFDALGAALRRRGHTTWRVGFNRGDERFWRDPASYIPYRGTSADWPDAFAAMLADKGATDLVLYGDTRGIHAAAIDLANERGLRIHVFEEGYLRPYWSTYERGGSNGHSRLMQMSVAAMAAALPAAEGPQTEAPAHWGDMRQHVFYGALYHFYVMFRNRAYRGFRPHRALPVAAEFRLHLRRLILMPLHRVERVIATARIRLGRLPLSPRAAATGT